jgi:hypothetical protein
MLKEFQYAESKYRWATVSLYVMCVCNVEHTVSVYVMLNILSVCI